MREKAAARAIDGSSERLKGISRYKLNWANVGPRYSGGRIAKFPDRSELQLGTLSRSFVLITEYIRATKSLSPPH